MYSRHFSLLSIALACLLGSVTATADEKTAILYSKANNQKIEVSIVSEDELNDLFAELAGRTDIPHDFLWDGSWARAHRMVRILESKDIIAGKAFVEGEFYPDPRRSVSPQMIEAGLTYHVAPVLMVAKGKNVVPYIIDPSLFSGPVPQPLWKAKLLAKPKAKLTAEYYTNRYVIDVKDKNKKLTEYSDEDLKEMQSTNREFARALFMFEEPGCVVYLPAHQCPMKKK